MSKNTIADIEDAYLTGQSQFQQWLAEREREFLKPLTDTMVAAFTRSLPPEVAAELDTLAPGAMDTLTEQYGGK